MGLLQYIILNMERMPEWNRGQIGAQACHASVAAITKFRDHPDTQSYISLENLPHMCKVLKGCKKNLDFEEFIKVLDERKLDYYLWLEDPGQIPTCVALRPYERLEVRELMRQFPLLN